MHPYDLILVILMGALGLAGAFWGVTRMAASLLGFLLAFLLGLKLAPQGPTWFGGWVESPEWARLIAFFVVFFGVMIAAALVAHLLRRFLKAVFLGWVDRVGGAATGVALALLVGAGLAMALTALPPANEPLLEDSVLAPYALGVADVARHLVPEEIAAEYQEKKQALLEAWRRRSEGD